MAASAQTGSAVVSKRIVPALQTAVYATGAA